MLYGLDLLYIPRFVPSEVVWPGLHLLMPVFVLLALYILRLFNETNFLEVLTFIRC